MLNYVYIRVINDDMYIWEMLNILHEDVFLNNYENIGNKMSL